MTTSLPPISNEDIMSVLKEAYPELFARRLLRVTRDVMQQISGQEEYSSFSLWVDLRSDLLGVYCVGLDHRGKKPREIPHMIIELPPTFYKATPDIESDIREVIKRWLESA